MSYSEIMFGVEQIKETLDMDKRLSQVEQNEKDLIVVSDTQPVSQPVGGLWLKTNGNNGTLSYSLMTETGYTEDKFFSVDSVTTSDNYTLKQLLENMGTSIAICETAGNNASKNVTSETFIPRKGSKILVYFTNDGITDVDIELSVNTTRGDSVNTTTGYLYEAPGKRLTGKKIKTGTLYQFLFLDKGFYLIGGGGTVGVATSETVGGILSGGIEDDLSVDGEGRVTVNHAEKATLDGEGNTITPNNHASSETTYGIGDNNQFGHVKLTDQTEEDEKDHSGEAASASAMISTNKKLQEVKTKIEQEFATRNLLINGNFRLKDSFQNNKYASWIATPFNCVNDSDVDGILMSENGEIKQTFNGLYRNTLYKVRADIQITDETYNEDDSKKISLIVVKHGEDPAEVDNIVTFINIDKILPISNEQYECSFFTGKNLEKGNFDIIIKTQNQSCFITFIEVLELKQSLSENKYRYASIENEEKMRSFGFSQSSGEENYLLTAKPNHLNINANFMLGIPSFSITDSEAHYNKYWRFIGKGDYLTTNEGLAIMPKVDTSLITIRQFFCQVEEVLTKNNGDRSATISADISNCLSYQLFITLLTEEKSIIEELKSPAINSGKSSFTVKIGEAKKIVLGVLITPKEDLSDIALKYIKLENGVVATDFQSKGYTEENSNAFWYDENSDCEVFNIIPNKNLLDNPDFAINQRAFNASYGTEVQEENNYHVSNTSQGEYGFDRWLTGANSRISTASNGGAKIEFVRYLGRTSGGYLRQYIDSPEKYFEKELTFSAKVKDFSPDCFIRIGTETGNSQAFSDKVYIKSKEEQIISVTTKLPSSYDLLFVEIGSDNVYGVYNYGYAKTGYVCYAKLEEGNKVTPFIKPNYEEELKKCQKYFQIVKIRDVKDYLLSSGTEYNKETYHLPVTMADTPKVSIISNNYDCLYVDTTNNLVPSSAYKGVGINNNTINYLYRTAGGVISTSTKKYLDLGYGKKGINSISYFSASDFDTSLKTRNPLGASAKQNYFFLRENNVDLICSCEHNRGKKPSYYYEMSPSSMKPGGDTITCSDGSTTAYKAFLNGSNSNYWSISTTSSLTLTYQWAVGYQPSIFGFTFSFKSTNGTKCKIETYYAPVNSTSFSSLSTFEPTTVDKEWHDYSFNNLGTIQSAGENARLTIGSFRIVIKPSTSGETVAGYLNGISFLR